MSGHVPNKASYRILQNDALKTQMFFECRDRYRFLFIQPENYELSTGFGRGQVRSAGWTMLMSEITINNDQAGNTRIRCLRRQITYRGFTLIEVIVALTIVAISAVVFYQYLGTSVTESAGSMLRLQNALALERVAENITADYIKNYKKNLPALREKINDGAAQPALVGYGEYMVVGNDYIGFAATDPEDQTNQAETEPTDERILKVTIENDQNETITMIFISHAD